MSNIVDDVSDYPCYTYSMRMWADHREPCGSDPAGLSLCPESEVAQCQENQSVPAATQDVRTLRMAFTVRNTQRQWNSTMRGSSVAIHRVSVTAVPGRESAIGTQASILSVRCA